MRKIKKQGFTLIEILFVIIIIGIIASMVIVAIAQSSKDKARIAKGLSYSDSLRARGQIEEATVSYWNFNNDVKDSWGGNDGTNNGASFVAGVVGDALSFSGTQYVLLPAASGTLNINVNPVTLEAWIKPNSVAGGIKEIVGRGTYASNGYGINLNGNKINLGIHGGGNFNSATALTTGNWYHVVGVINGASSKIYINGVADIATGNVSVVNSSLNGSIGASSIGA